MNEPQPTDGQTALEHFRAQPGLQALFAIIDTYADSDEAAVPAFGAALNDYLRDAELHNPGCVGLDDGHETWWSARVLMPDPPVSIGIEFWHEVVLFEVHPSTIYILDTGGDSDTEQQSYTVRIAHLAEALTEAARLNAAVA